MSLINYIEELAGKDKLEIEFHLHDYLEWEGVKNIYNMGDIDYFIGRELDQLMKCYWYYAGKLCNYAFPLQFNFYGRNIISELNIENESVKVSFTKESLKLRYHDDWISRIVKGCRNDYRKIY